MLFQKYSLGYGVMKMQGPEHKNKKTKSDERRFDSKECERWRKENNSNLSLKEFPT